MQSIDKQEYFFKILMVGSQGVGKTSLSNRFFDKEYDEKLTIGVDFQTKIFEILGDNVRIQVWDQAGAERFRSIQQIYYRRIQGAILTYDITDKISFSEVNRWYQDIQNSAPANVQIVLVGNKTDLNKQRKITFDEGQSLANSLNIPVFFETSAKDNQHAKEPFIELIKLMIEKIGKSTTLKIPLSAEERHFRKGWCFCQ